MASKTLSAGLLAALAIGVPTVGASAQMQGPSISGWAIPDPAPEPEYDYRVPPAAKADVEIIPHDTPWAAPDQTVTRWGDPNRQYRNDQDGWQQAPAPPAYQQSYQDDRAMPPGWRPGYPDNSVGTAQPADGNPTVLGHRAAQSRIGIPTAPQNPTFDDPAAEAPGAVTAMRGNSREDAAIQTLLDQGYSRINPVEPDGKGFVTYAERDGKQMRLWVDPETGEINRLPD